MKDYKIINYLTKIITTSKGNLSQKISFTKELFEIIRQQENSAYKFMLGKPYPILSEKTDNAGGASGHYFHQDLLVARRIFQNNPVHHVDVGSRVDGFIAHVASFRKIEVFDIRPLPQSITNINFTQADLMVLNERFTSFCDSLSCLHALEHFGLGRYGDPINYEGYVKGLENLHRILKPGGKFYLSLPIGPQRIEFNAHRFFSIKHILELLKNRFILDIFSYVGDDGKLYEDVELSENNIKTNCNCSHGCGIFELTKC